MIICSCNRLTDHDVRGVAAEGSSRTVRTVYGCLGCSPQCGRCARTIRRIMSEALGTSAGANRAWNNDVPDEELVSSLMLEDPA